MSDVRTGALFFGVFIVISLPVGVITPPLGNATYVLVGITDQPFEAAVNALIQFIVTIPGTYSFLHVIRKFE